MRHAGGGDTPSGPLRRFLARRDRTALLSRVRSSGTGGRATAPMSDGFRTTAAAGRQRRRSMALLTIGVRARVQVAVSAVLVLTGVAVLALAP
jgi:hypothetical protein